MQYIFDRITNLFSEMNVRNTVHVFDYKPIFGGE